MFERQPISNYFTKKTQMKTIVTVLDLQKEKKNFAKLTTS